MQATQPRLPLLVVAVLFCVLLGCRTPQPNTHTSPFTTLPKRSKEAEARSNQRIEAQSRFAAGMAYDLNREPEKAIEQYILSLKADPSNEDLALQVSQRLANAQDPNRALEVIQIAAESENPSAAIYTQLGALFGELGQYNEAESANLKAIELSPFHLASYQNVYSLRLQREAPDHAVAILDRAYEQDSEEPAYWLNLAELYANYYRNFPDDQNRVAPQLQTCLDRADELGVTGADRLRLADGLTLIGETDRAVILFLELLEDDSTSMARRNTVRQKLLSIYVRSDDIDGAITQLESLVADYPANPQANFLLASFAMENGRIEMAAEHFRRTIQLNPEYQEAYTSLGSLLILDPEHASEGIEVLNEAKKRFGATFVTDYYLATGHYTLEQYDLAVEHYTAAEIAARADSRISLDHRFYFAFGAAHERNGTYDQAAELFEKCLGMKSDFAQALNYLGYMWADQGVNLERARELIEKAVELEPENAAFLDSLAWVLFKLDQPHLALVHMQEAIKYHGDEAPDPVLYDHLGDIQLAVGEPDRARQAWEQALEIEDNPEIREKLDRLEPPADGE